MRSLILLPYYNALNLRPQQSAQLTPQSLSAAEEGTMIPILGVGILCQQAVTQAQL